MVSRLLIDLVWRNRWAYVGVSSFLLLVWPLALVSDGEVGLTLSMPALSLLFASALGPMVAIGSMGLRELRHVPVTSRDIWRTTWIAATVVAPAYLLVTKMIAALLVVTFGGTLKVSAETILLSAVYDFAWAGAILPVLPLLGYVANAAAARRTVTASLIGIGMIVSMLACFGWPIVAGNALPTRLGAFTPATIAILIACLAITFWALWWTPQRGAIAGERTQAHQPVARSTPAHRARLADRLTGLSRVLVPHLLLTFAFVFLQCLAAGAYGLASGSGFWWFVPQVTDSLDPASSGINGLGFVMMGVGIWTMQGLWTPWARLLKMLPLSVRQLTALLVLSPFATWAVLWPVGLAVYSLAYGMPGSLRMDLAFGLAGLSALVQSVLFRFQGRTFFAFAPAFIGGLLAPFFKNGLRGGGVAEVTLLAIGLIAIGAATFINYRTLTRSTSSSRAYRRPELFGVPKPFAVR